MITRSPAQKPAHKDLGRNGQSPAITPKATYASASNRAGSRSAHRRTNYHGKHRIRPAKAALSPA
ncbi:hypothetical protein DBP95_13815 [Lacticaseibacillus rhamnosus]|nr:hypothetical protein DBP95_13815 [Lacticaseibacillus rhamnosus]PTS02058.1 hypothetical protein DBQ08_13005 [Lacticaseibacillus rhamnosus]